MGTVQNRRWLLAERPTGLVDERNFRWSEDPIPQAEADGEIVVRNLFLSCDPTQRGWMARDTYVPAVGIGEVMRSFAAGRVEQSRSAEYAVGDVVGGMFGWQDYALVQTTGRVAAKPMKIPPGVPIPLAMSTLGATGITAYFGLLEIGRPKEGETVVVSAAAGATGSVAAQIAKIKGCRVIGIAGGTDKCEWLLREAKLDSAIDYKTENVVSRLAELCPKGIDVYFDNVGGDVLDAALAKLAMRGRVVLCGAMSQYNATDLPPGPKHYINLLLRRGRMEGFIVMDYMNRALEAVGELAGWVASGKIVNRVDVQKGLENAPRALKRLFLGQNQGKQLVQIAD